MGRLNERYSKFAAMRAKCRGIQMHSICTSILGHSGTFHVSLNRTHHENVRHVLIPLGSVGETDSSPDSQNAESPLGLGLEAPEHLCSYAQ